MSTYSLPFFFMTLEHIRQAEQVADARTKQARPNKTVLLIGAKGRQGEAILNALLAQPSIATVQVLAKQAMATPTHKLVTKAITEELDAQTVVLNLDADLAPKEKKLPKQHEYSLRRDDNYIAINRDNEATILQALEKNTNLKALYLIAPLSAFQQYSRSAAYALNEFEFKCRSLNSPHLSILRPLAEHATGDENPGFIQSFVRFWFSQFRWILPNPNAHLQSKDIAKALALAMESEQPGIRLWSANDIAEHLKHNS